MTTQAAKSKQVPPPDEPYTNIEMRLVCASKIRVRNGEHAGKVIDWDATMLRVYLYLFNQVKGFESKEGMFYQSQKKIWLSTNIGKTKLNEVLSALKILGLITDTGERKKVNGAPRGLVKLTASRLKDVIENLEIDFADFDGEPVWDHQRASGKKRSKSYVQKADSSKKKSTMQEAPQAQQEPSPQDNADEPAPNEGATPNSMNGSDQGDAYFAPWSGDTFIHGHLSENALQWAKCKGATDWRDACRIVWNQIGVTAPTEIDETHKPLSCAEDQCSMKTDAA
ncbi:DUF6945 domain-containing protein [Pantoea cypripedii]|uniref:Uncharacterized protein n=1 Tax=Pantoea cypripedii TaxID=55209 RepID=A0A6B9FZ15_PANCY|nr:hypothetical protein [Pantoea cypripedii]QGY29378.1 hypothetical protein CUN67_10715 [Pantoea cypripedii]